MTKLYNMWFNLKTNVKSNLTNRKGQGMVEYVLIIAFIAIIVLAAITPLGSAIADKFNEVVDTLTPDTTTTTPSGT